LANAINPPLTRRTGERLPSPQAAGSASEPRRVKGPLPRHVRQGLQVLLGSSESPSRTDSSRSWTRLLAGARIPSRTPIRGNPFPRLRLSRIARVPQERIPARVGEMIPAGVGARKESRTSVLNTRFWCGKPHPTGLHSLVPQERIPARVGEMIPAGVGARIPMYIGTRTSVKTGRRTTACEPQAATLTPRFAAPLLPSVFKTCKRHQACVCAVLPGPL